MGSRLRGNDGERGDEVSAHAPASKHKPENQSVTGY